MSDLDLEDFGEDVSPGESDRRDDSYECDTKLQGNLEQWSMQGTDYVAIEKSFKVLAPGMYIHRENHEGKIIFKRLPIKVDDLIRFPDGITDNVLREIETFWTRGDAFSRYGFLHRRGYLFYGPQGSGKSSIVQQIVKDIIDRSGVVFLCNDPAVLNKALQVFRQVEPTRQIVCLFEDIDAIIKDQGEDEVLSLLDGENQVDMVLNIATTNYPERLDKRIVARPRRFDRVLKIDMPNEAVRKRYFQHKLAQSDDLKKWVAETNGLSFASLAEAVISVKCLGNSFEETMRILKSMRGKESSKDFDESKLGFAAND